LLACDALLQVSLADGYADAEKAAAAVLAKNLGVPEAELKVTESFCTF